MQEKKENCKIADNDWTSRGEVVDARLYSAWVRANRQNLLVDSPADLNTKLPHPPQHLKKDLPNGEQVNNISSVRTALSLTVGGAEFPGRYIVAVCQKTKISSGRTCSNDEVSLIQYSGTHQSYNVRAPDKKRKHHHRGSSYPELE